ncbi:MAG: hypothetical protein JWO77_500 [Ilumatobacteraceae bacterium]|nr:hypothetical protein [Ilumatobacteraceae bacterium]
MRLTTSPRPAVRVPAVEAGATPAIELAVDALATYRLTRLATADIISEPIRRSIVGRALNLDDADSGSDPDAGADSGVPAPTAQQLVDDTPDPPGVARLVTCRWCAGVWIAGGVVAARRFAPAWWDPAAKALALSAVGVLISALEDG